MRTPIWALLGAAAFTLLACDPPAAETPAALSVIVAPESSISNPFTLQGNLAIETCDADGNTFARPISSLAIHARGLPSPTCDSSSDPTCATRAPNEGAAAVLVHGGATGQYTIPLQRLIYTNDPTPTEIGPITYRLAQISTGGSPRVFVQSSTRWIDFGRPTFDQLAPANNGDVVDMPIENRNMASLRLTLRFKPTRVDGNGALDLANGPDRVISGSTNATPIVVTTSAAHGFTTGDTVELTGHTGNTAANGVWTVKALSSTRFELVGSVGNGVGGASGTAKVHLGASERISVVRIGAIGTEPSPGSHSVSHFFGSSTRIFDLGQDPAQVDGYLDAPARVLNDDQVVRLEIPITPSTGPLAVSTYAMSIRVVFDDSTAVQLSLPGSALPELANVQPCATITLPDIVISKPRTEIDGSIALRPAPGFADSPYVSFYAPLLRWMSSPNADFIAGSYVKTTISGATIYQAAPADHSAPYTFTWRGFPEGDYRFESRMHSSGDTSYQAANALLEFPGRPQFRFFNSDNPDSPNLTARFAFPTLGSTAASTAKADFATSGQFSALEDAPVALDVSGDMAYLGGDVALQGCVTNAKALSSGAAELLGAVPTGLTGGSSNPLVGGFARGLFKANDTNYLVAAIAGSWTESRYRLKLDEPAPVGQIMPAYDGLIVIEPANPASHVLTTGDTAPGASRTYATSRVTVTLVTGPGGVKNPRLEIGEDLGPSAGLVPFYHPGTGELLGRYYAVSNDRSDRWVVNPSISIYGLSSAQSVNVVPSDIVLSNGKEAREYRAGIPVTLTSSGGGCDDICIQYNLDGSTATYTDDGQGPTITVPSSVPAGTTKLTVTLQDQVPITEVTVGGVKVPVATSTPSGSGFTATVDVDVTLVTGANELTLTAKGLCGNVTTKVVTVTMATDVCGDPALQMCMADAPGSVFYVDLTNAAGKACQLPCSIADVGAALTCDTTAITCAP